MIRLAQLLFLPVVMAACTARVEGSAPMTRNLTPTPLLDFIDGPSATDEPALRAWLKARESDKHELRLPVAMENSGTGLRNFKVGAVAIEVDDTALGISLHDRVRALCGDAERCSAWLEGYWAQGRLSLRKAGARVVESNPRAGREADRRSGQAAGRRWMRRAEPCCERTPAK
jgi:hypothetical protein